MAVAMSMKGMLVHCGLLFRAARCLALAAIGGGYLTACGGKAYPAVSETEFHGHPTTASVDFTREPLSPAVALGFQEYLAETVPIAFAIEENGAFFQWWQCETQCRYDMSTVLRELIGACEVMRVGSRCYIAYAGSTPSSDHRFTQVMPHGLMQAERTTALGPAEAHGAIVYFPGFNGWNYHYHNAHMRMDDAWVPALYRALNGRGWDINVLRIKNQHDRSALWRDSGAFRKVAGEVVEALRREGYRRIVLAGHSRGAAEVLLATANGVTPDAVIVSEPNDSGGVLSRDGEKNELNEEQAGEMFARILASQTPKTVLIYFEASFWTGNFSEYRDTRPLPDSVFLIENPKGFRGHSAEGSQRFAGHAECISGYLLGKVAHYRECRLPQYDLAEIRYWQNRDHITHAGLEPSPAEEVAAKLSGNSVCGFDWDEQRVRLDWKCGYFGPNFRVKDSGTYIDYPFNNFGEIRYVDGGYCTHDGFSPYTDSECFEAFFVDDKVFIVDQRERDAVMLVVLPGNQIKTHDVVCASTSNGIRCAKREADETPVQAGVRIGQSMK